MSESLQSYLARCQERVQQALDRILPPADTVPANLHQAMRYATLGGGKRVRPVLVYASGMALGCDMARLDIPACAVELIHAYSLVHDDLPAMDDDDLRRGRPTCHVAFDEATAILTGDALQTLAFEILADQPIHDLSASDRVAMIRELALASGSHGMAGGQALDLAATGREIDLPALENLHIRKTGELIRCSVRLGVLTSGNQDPELRKALDRYAACIGLAFQVQDDILDVTGSAQEIGKTAGADAAAHKSTYPALIGLSDAKAKAQDLIDQALASLEPLGAHASHLADLARFIVARRS